MTYTPTPYDQLRPVASATLRKYCELEVSLEVADPANPDGELIEHEFSFFYTVQPAEPDVGIMSAYPDDWFYAEGDGTPVPPHVHAEVDKIDCKDASRVPVSKAMDDWHGRNMERAMECANESDGGDW